MTPVPLQEWISAQIVDDDLLWKGAWGDQVAFVRDRVQPLVAAGLDYEESKIATVISTHTSKSTRLPVYDLARPDLGLRIVLRGNYYNWKMSVMTELPLEVDLAGLCYTTPPVEREYTGDCLASCYFEGFPKDLIFSYYATSDKRRWSAEFGGPNALWTAVFLIMRAAGAVKPYVWHTRESHRLELDRQSERWRKAK